jgi:uncharacterized membrane protein YraQ (UPF0718 family)
MEVLVAGLVVLALSAGTLRAFVVGRPDLATAATVFCGVFVQALPFLALGVVISGLIAAYVSPDRLARWLNPTNRCGDPDRRRRGCRIAWLRVWSGSRCAPVVR